MSLSLAVPVWKRQRWSAWIPFLLFQLAAAGSFLGLYALSTRFQEQLALDGLRTYWAASFPPLYDPIRFLRWLIDGPHRNDVRLSGGRPRRHEQRNAPGGRRRLGLALAARPQRGRGAAADAVRPGAGGRDAAPLPVRHGSPSDAVRGAGDLPARRGWAPPGSCTRSPGPGRAASSRRWRSSSWPGSLAPRWRAT